MTSKDSNPYTHYLHSKYAGGDADVIKHACLVSALSQLPHPVHYLETHAGAGLYYLSVDNGEHLKGIARCYSLLDSLPALLPYKATLDRYQNAESSVYPASPILSAQSAMVGTQSLFEINPEVAQVLKAYLPNAAVSVEDGFSRTELIDQKSFVFIDPPYKAISDYQAVKDYVLQAKDKKPVAVMVWLPWIYQAHSEWLLTFLIETGIIYRCPRASMLKGACQAAYFFVQIRHCAITGKRSPITFVQRCVSRLDKCLQTFAIFRAPTTNRLSPSGYRQYDSLGVHYCAP